MTLFLTISLLASLTYARVLHVVDIGHEDKEVTTAAKIAILTCQVSQEKCLNFISQLNFLSQGLMNRAPDGEGVEAVFTISQGWDAEWLETAVDMDPDLEPTPINWYNFLEEVSIIIIQQS